MRNIIFIAAFLCSISLSAQPPSWGGPFTPLGNAGGLNWLKGITRTDSGLQLANGFHKGSGDSARYVWYDALSTSMFYHTGVKRLRLLSLNDTDFIKSLGGSDVQTLSIVGKNLSIIRGNTIALPFAYQTAFADSVDSLSARIERHTSGLFDTTYFYETLVDTVGKMIHDSGANYLHGPFANYLTENPLSISTDTAFSSLGTEAYVNSRLLNVFYKGDSNTHKNPITFDYFYAHLLSTDTTSLSDRINQRVKYSDSLVTFATPKNLRDSANSVRAAIPNVSVKVNYSDSLVTFATPKNLRDTAAQLRSGINSKLNISDTGTYIATVKGLKDTATALRTLANTKLNISDTGTYIATIKGLRDTASALRTLTNTKLNISDTGVYIATIKGQKDTAAALRSLANTKLNIADTGVYIATIKGQRDTAAALRTLAGLKLNASDTGVYIATVKGQKDTASSLRTLANTKLNISDTGVYIATVKGQRDTATALRTLAGLKQNLSDTTTWDATRSWTTTRQLTGFSATPGIVANTDSVAQAISKLYGNSINLDRQTAIRATTISLATEQPLDTLTISAGRLGANDAIILQALLYRAGGGAGICSLRVYITPDKIISNGVQVAQLNWGTGTNGARFTREFPLNSLTSFDVYSPTTSAMTDNTTSSNVPQNITSINFANVNYVIIAVTLQAPTDVCAIWDARIRQDRSQ